MEVLTVETRSKTECVDITQPLRGLVAESGIRRGLLRVFIPHTTAGVTLNERADPDVRLDMAEALERMVPRQAAYRHAEGNAAAHVKASLMGAQAMVFIEEGNLALGIWQGVFLWEFDGPRKRKVWVRLEEV